MTESIAPETAKLATTPKPAITTPLKTPDKPESVAKIESATKPSPTPEAPKPEAPKTATGTLLPAPGGETRSPLGRVGHKKQAAIVASALFSLIAGIAGVQLMWPKTDDTKSAQTPTQPLTNNSKQPDGSTGNNIPPAGLPSAPNSPLSPPPQPISPPNVVPSPLAPLQPSADKQSAQFMITDQVLTALRTANVPESVVVRFALSKNKEFSQQDMQKEIDRVLTFEEKTQYQSYILYYAEQHDKPASPLSKSPGETVSQPVGIPTTRYMITDQVLTTLRTVNVPESVVAKFAYAKNKEFSQKDMEKEIATVLSPEEKQQYQSYILYYAKQPDKPASPFSKSPGETVSQPTGIPPTRFMITDLVLTDLRNAKVPETVLMNFTFMKNKEFSQKDMEKEIATILSPEEKQQYQNYILYYAKQPDKPASPSGKPQGEAGSQTGFGSSAISPQSPSASIVPTPSPNIPAFPQMPNFPSPQPVSPVTQGATHDQFGSPGSRNHSNANSAAASPTPDLPGFAPNPLPPISGVLPGGPQVITTGGFQAPSNPGTTQPPAPMIPAIPGVNPPTPSPAVPVIPVGPTPMVPAIPQMPSFGGGQSSSTTPGVIIPPTPGGDMNPKPTTPVMPNVGLPGTPTVGIPSPGDIKIPPVSPVPSVFVTPSDHGNNGGTNGTGTAIHVTKPPSSPPVTPVAAIERSPTTSYDVDLYEPKSNDSWESISQEFYNDKRYAAALKAINNNKPLTAGGMVDIPPIYILKQKFQTPAGTRTSNGQASPPPSPPPSWAPSVATSPATPNGGSKTYKVPPGGITMRAIARNYLGSDQRWGEIYNLNPQITKPDGVIPEGTDIRLPADANLAN